MYTLDKAAAAVMDTLTAGLAQPGDEGSSRKIENSGGTYMAVCVERIGQRVYSVAHYYVSNGDMVCDPDMTFLHAETGNWCPLTFEQGGVCYRVAVELDSNEKPAKWREQELRGQVEFANQWMRNIKEQQGLV